MHPRSKSARPQATKPQLRQHALTISQAIRIDEVALLEAAIIGSAEVDIIDQGKRSVPRRVIDDAFDLYGKAWEFIKRTAESSASAVRGCSKELIVLAARQAVLLDDLLTRQELQAREYAEAKDKTRQRLQDAFNRAVKLRDQARRVLAKLSGTDDDLKAEINFAAMTEDSDAAIQEALNRLSQFGRRLLSDGDPVRCQRVRLYGVDEAYLQMLDAVSAELSLTEQQFEKLAEHESQADLKINWCAGVNLILMGQVIEAFMAANDVDPSVPFLRPVHHEHLVRRLSMLPAPPPPQALSKSSKTSTNVGPVATRSKLTITGLKQSENGRVEPRPQPNVPLRAQPKVLSDSDVEGPGGAFHGLLGNRK